MPTCHPDISGNRAAGCCFNIVDGRDFVHVKSRFLEVVYWVNVTAPCFRLTGRIVGMVDYTGQSDR